MNTEFVTIESHFGVPENFIRSLTRNKCSEDLIGIIREIALALYPNEEFEIYALPSEDGSYKDIIRIVKKELNKTPIISVCAIGTLAVSLLVLRNNFQEHKYNLKMQTIDTATKCLALRKQIDELDENHELENIPDEKIDEICSDIKLKKLKNDRYKTLQEDEMVASDETILKDDKEQIIVKNKIEREDFEKFIEVLPVDESYLKENMEGVVELISLVVKQKKEGKGLPWRGVYYGNDIIDRGVNILSNGEEINFYMQDKDFKSKIDNHEITFSRDDNMRVLFNLTGVLNIDDIQNKSIYIKEVKKFNEDIIEHRAKTTKQSYTTENQASLF